MNALYSVRSAFLLAPAFFFSANVAAQQTTDIALEEVVVTAQKRAESLQDVPISMSVLGGDKIATANIRNMQEMAPYIPNFYQVKTTITNEIYIRGIGSSGNAGFEQSVGMFYDGVYMSRARQTLTPFFDLQRVEVLRGPQPILFGKNTSAGAVSMISNAPTDSFEAGITALGGTLGERRFEGTISGPLSDSVSGRLALFGQHGDGWVENRFDGKDGPETDDYAARGILAFAPSDTFSGFFKAEHSEIKQTGAPYEVSKNTQIPVGFAVSPNGWSPPQLVGIEDKLDYKGNFGNTAPLAPLTVTYDTALDNAVLQLDFLIGELTLTSVTGYSGYEFKGRSDLDMSPVNLIGADQHENYSQWSQEFRISSPVGNFFDYIGGIYLQTADYKIETDVGFVFTTISPIAPSASDGQRSDVFDQHTDTASAFFQGTFNFTSDIRLKAGVRYTYEEKSLDRSVAVSSFELGALAPGNSAIDDLLINAVWLDQADTFPYQASPSRTENDWSPLLGLEWDVTDTLLLYGTATKGFKGGGYDSIHSNGKKLDELEYEPETAYAYELGAKSTFWGNRAMVNAALFLTTFNDLQVTLFNGTTGFNVSNAAAATSKGAELESRFLLTPDFILSASMAYLDYTFDDYDGAPCTTAQLSQQIVDTGGKAGCVNDQSGATSTFAPRWSGAFSGTYTVQLSDSLDMLFTLDANYRSEFYLAPDLDENLVQEATWVLNGRIALNSADGHWGIALIGKNLTRAISSSVGDDVPFGNATVYDIPDFGGSYFRAVDPPRSWALEANYRFF